MKPWSLRLGRRSSPGEDNVMPGMDSARLREW
jgi:hypothetical protein